MSPGTGIIDRFVIERQYIKAHTTGSFLLELEFYDIYQRIDNATLGGPGSRKQKAAGSIQPFVGRFRWDNGVKQYLWEDSCHTPLSHVRMYKTINTSTNEGTSSMTFSNLPDWWSESLLFNDSWRREVVAVFFFPHLKHGNA